MNCTDAIQYLGPYLDSELDIATTVQIQAHLTRCPRCSERFDQEHALENRIAESLMGHSAPEDGRRWETILERVLPKPKAARHRGSRLRFWASSAAANWFSLVASLVILAALASAGLGLRHSGQLIIPGASWMLQRYALHSGRPLGDLMRMPYGHGSRADGGVSPWPPDA